MIVGDASVFAIESGITKTYERGSLLALGFFLIHVGGRTNGVNKPDAAMLACSLDEVRLRLTRRGTHTAPFAANSDAGRIADAFRNAFYAEKQDESYFDIPRAEFIKLFDRKSNDLTWAPDGDRAFDDGSYVLQFDVNDRVRLVAFRSGDNYSHDPSTLADVWLAADEFYSLLQQWLDDFKAEWTSMAAARLGQP